MRKLLVLFVLVLLAATVVSAQEQTQESGRGWWTNFVSWFKPVPAEAQPTAGGEAQPTTAVAPSEGGGAGDQVPSTETQTVPTPTVVAQPAASVETAEVKAVEPPQPTVASPVAVQAIAVKPTIGVVRADCYAYECKVTICVNDYQQEIFCPKDYDSCSKAYNGRCRSIGCEPYILQQTCTCPACPVCGQPSECTEKVHLCYYTYTDNTGEKAKKEVRCEGDYKSCMEKYGWCNCGLQTEAILPTATRVTTAVPVTTEESCCCKVAVTGNQVVYKKYPKSQCASCVEDSLCAQTSSSSTSTQQT